MTVFDDQELDLTATQPQPRPLYNSWEDGALLYIGGYETFPAGSADSERWESIHRNTEREAAAYDHRDIISTDVDALNRELTDEVDEWVRARLAELRSNFDRRQAAYRALEAHRRFLQRIEDTQVQREAKQREIREAVEAIVQDVSTVVDTLCRLIGTSEQPSTFDPMRDGTVAIVVPQVIQVTHKEWIAEDRLVIGGAGRAYPTLIVPSLSGRLCVGRTSAEALFQVAMGWREPKTPDQIIYVRRAWEVLQSGRLPTINDSSDGGLAYNAIPAPLLRAQRDRTHNVVVLNVITTYGGAYNGAVYDFCTGGTPIGGVPSELRPIVSACVNAASPEVQTSGRMVVPEPPASWINQIISLLPLIQADNYPVEAAINQLCKVPAALYQGNRSWSYLARRVRADRSVELVNLEKHTDEPDWSACFTARTRRNPNASSTLEDGVCPCCGDEADYTTFCLQCDEPLCEGCSYSCANCGEEYICTGCFRDGNELCGACDETTECPNCGDSVHPDEVWTCTVCDGGYCECRNQYRCYGCRDHVCDACTINVGGDRHCTTCVENSGNITYCECCSEHVYAEGMTHCENCEVATCDDCWTGERCECGRTYCEDCTEEAVYKCDNCDITGCGCPGCDEVKEMTTLNGEQVFLHDACCGEWEALRNERVIPLGEDHTERLPFAA